MNDNLDIDPDIDLNNLPRLSTADIQDYTSDLVSWQSTNAGFAFLTDLSEQDDQSREIKSEPSSHSSAEYNDPFQNKFFGDPYQSVQMLTNTSLSAVPSNKDFAGAYNFDVKVACSKPGTQKPQVTFSQMMNKAYINMGHTLPIDFSWNPMTTGLFVRATMLYSCPHEAPNLVKRCNNHKSVKVGDVGDHSNNSDHVLLCKSLGAQYFGSLENNTHLNVTVPLGIAQAGDSSVRVLYEFACKHSCISGMNRRSVECVFTLESLDGQILGRKKIGIRVCSCPKRDMAKEEEHEEKPILGKRKAKNSPDNLLPVEIPKKLKEAGGADTKCYTLPVIMGSSEYATMVQIGFALMKTKMDSSPPEDKEKLQPYVAEFEKLKNEIEKKTDA